MRIRAVVNIFFSNLKALVYLFPYTKEAPLCVSTVNSYTISKKFCINQ
jgi:hypothetical protein